MNIISWNCNKINAASKELQIIVRVDNLCLRNQTNNKSRNTKKTDKNYWRNLKSKK